MGLSILQISDLHRDPANPIRNGPLLASLDSDLRRYAEGEPAIRKPDLIFVSGDVIQGIPPATSDFENQLRIQYGEALDFLGRLTDMFLDGDRERVVIVPGNHDVSACHFLQSAKEVDIAAGRKKELVTQLFSANSALRWSWSDFALYEITDSGAYSRRLEAFAEFYKEFYAGRRVYKLDPEEQFDVFDYPAFNVTVAAFSSCFNNDFFNKQGAIHPSCISDAGLRLDDPQFNQRVRIAVWHHNTEGLPVQSDYMDSDTLQNLIDRGFSVGFHGHQHRPQFLDMRFRYGGDRRITVISAGTLCGSASFRFGRAYNVVELDTESCTGRLHLREMQNDNLAFPIWGRRSLPPESAAFLSFKFDPPPAPKTPSDPVTSALRTAQVYIEDKNYQQAAEALKSLSGKNDIARRLLLECFVRLADHVAIISWFDPPRSASEAIALMDALWEKAERHRLSAILADPAVADSEDPSVIELRKKYLAKVRRG